MNYRLLTTATEDLARIAHYYERRGGVVSFWMSSMP